MKSAIPALCFSLLVVVLSSCGGGAEDVVVGGRVPDFSLTSVDGKKVTSRSFTGNVVILNFWATWCQNCKKELPMFKQFAARSDAQVVGIALDEGGLATVKPFVEKTGINYPVLLGNQRIFNRFQGLAIPYTLVLDRNQHIIKIYHGPVSEESLEAALQEQKIS